MCVCAAVFVSPVQTQRLTKTTFLFIAMAQKEKNQAERVCVGVCVCVHAGGAQYLCMVMLTSVLSV